MNLSLPKISLDFLQMSLTLSLGTGGVDTMDDSGIFDISNLDRLGHSEYELVQAVVDGVKILVNLEKALEKGEDIDDAIKNLELEELQGPQ